MSDSKDSNSTPTTPPPALLTADPGPSTRAQLLTRYTPKAPLSNMSPSVESYLQSLVQSQFASLIESHSEMHHEIQTLTRQNGKLGVRLAFAEGDLRAEHVELEKKPAVDSGIAGKFAELEKKLASLEMKLAAESSNAGKFAELERKLTWLEKNSSNAGKLAEMERTIITRNAVKLVEVERKLVSLEEKKPAAADDSGNASKLAEMERKLFLLERKLAIADRSNADKVTEVEDKIADLEAALDDKADDWQIDDAMELSKNNEEKVRDLKTYFDDKLASMEEGIAGCVELKGKIDEKLASLEEDIGFYGELEDQVDMVNDRCDAFESRDSGFGKALDGLEEAMKGVQRSVERERGLNAEARNKVDELKAQVEVLGENGRVPQEEHEGLEKRVSPLEAAVEAADKNMKELKESVEQMSIRATVAEMRRAASSMRVENGGNSMVSAEESVELKQMVLELQKDMSERFKTLTESHSELEKTVNSVENHMEEKMEKLNEKIYDKAMEMEDKMMEMEDKMMEMEGWMEEMQEKTEEMEEQMKDKVGLAEYGKLEDNVLALEDTVDWWRKRKEEFEEEVEEEEEDGDEDEDGGGWDELVRTVKDMAKKVEFVEKTLEEKADEEKCVLLDERLDAVEEAVKDWQEYYNEGEEEVDEEEVEKEEEDSGLTQLVKAAWERMDGLEEALDGKADEWKCVEFGERVKALEEALSNITDDEDDKFRMGNMLARLGNLEIDVEKGKLGKWEETQPASRPCFSPWNDWPSYPEYHFQSNPPTPPKEFVKADPFTCEYPMRRNLPITDMRRDDADSNIDTSAMASDNVRMDTPPRQSMPFGGYPFSGPARKHWFSSLNARPVGEEIGGVVTGMKESTQQAAAAVDPFSSQTIPAQTMAMKVAIPTEAGMMMAPDTMSSLYPSHPFNGGHPAVPSFSDPQVPRACYYPPSIPIHYQPPAFKPSHLQGWTPIPPSYRRGPNPHQPQSRLGPICREVSIAKQILDLSNKARDDKEAKASTTATAGATDEATFWRDMEALEDEPTLCEASDKNKGKEKDHDDDDDDDDDDKGEMSEDSEDYYEKDSDEEEEDFLVEATESDTEDWDVDDDEDGTRVFGSAKDGRGYWVA
ncbi:hypothetical protein QBC40DRAFT_269387 [Triangularia verruculosa]|uniref:Uncharacterized protein n=1 Tax=Triangularia verruculosa TaxID=2587418 RepID=A0AAN6XCK1_9PEZI|nr:hypothetical protein QBC40DRAFT_269387 [Triangularia verruculosa]